MRGTLNFKDDPTHVRVYSVPELRKLIEARWMSRKVGGRHAPEYLVYPGDADRVPRMCLSARGILLGNVFWDLHWFCRKYLWVVLKGNPV